MTTVYTTIRLSNKNLEVVNINYHSTMLSTACKLIRECIYEERDFIIL